jgi:hypothetical protein
MAVDEDCPKIRCDFLLPGTSYEEVREKKFPKVPEAFIYDRAATSGNIFNSLKLIILSFLLP